MKTRFKIIIILVAITSIGCSSDDDNAGMQPKEENTRMTSYTIEDVEFNMTYNEAGMLTKYRYGNPSATAISNIEYNPDGNITKHGSFNYSYNAHGDIENITKTNNPLIIQIAYNSQNYIETITAINDDGNGGAIETGTTTFEYNSNGLPVEINEFNNVTPVSPFAKTMLSYDDNGNIIERYIQRSNDGISYYDFSTTVYTYDDKKNPYQVTIGKTGITNKHILQQFIGLYSTYYSGQVSLVPIYFVSPNNLLTEEDDLKLISYSYTYNEDDYPMSVERTWDASMSGGSISTTNRIFSYETY